VNICGLFKLNGGPNFSAETYRSFIASHLGDSLKGRFEQCELEEASFCAVAGLSLTPESPLDSKECRIGDSICMIAPLTGNGMSLAFESASCASGTLMRYSKGFISSDEARRTISQNCDEQFGKRIRSAHFLQRCVFARPGQWLFRSALKICPSVFRGLFAVTRR